MHALRHTQRLRNLWKQIWEGTGQSATGFWSVPSNLELTSHQPAHPTSSLSKDGFSNQKMVSPLRWLRAHPNIQDELYLGAALPGMFLCALQRTRNERNNGRQGSKMRFIPCQVMARSNLKPTLKNEIHTSPRYRKVLIPTLKTEIDTRSWCCKVQPCKVRPFGELSSGRIRPDTLRFSGASGGALLVLW